MFVQGLFHRLRRLCNHPLLAQTKLQDSDYAALVKALCEVRPDFKRAKPGKALSEVRTWSDYEVCSAIREHGIEERLGRLTDAARFLASREELLEGSAKVTRLLQILEKQRAAKRKTLVFSQYTHFLDLIGEAVELAGFPFARLDGSTGVEARPGIVRNFSREDSGVDVFLLSTKAGGTGLNLVSADCVVLMDLSFNPQDNRQAEDRVHRLGQTRPVTVHYLLCEGTVEEAILQSNMQKVALDYKFGGQKLLLKGDKVPDHGCGSEEEEEEEAAGERDVKQAERAVLQQLEQSCGLKA